MHKYSDGKGSMGSDKGHYNIGGLLKTGKGSFSDWYKSKGTPKPMKVHKPTGKAAALAKKLQGNEQKRSS